MKLLKFIFLIVLMPALVDAQELWTLERCIQHAFEQNITIKQTELSEQIAENNLLESKLSLLPNVDFTGSHGYNFGNSVDPTTFEFVKVNTRTNSFSLGGSIPIFTGLQQINNIKRSKIELEISQADVDQIKENIALTITSYYLQILLNKEILQSSAQQIEITREQLKQTEKLIDAGVLPKGDILDIEAQMANDELRMINAENSVILSRLNLKLLLQITDETDFDIVTPVYELPAGLSLEKLSPKILYAQALEFKPEIHAAQLRLNSAETSLAIAKGSLSPTLSLSGSVRTNFFSESMQVAGEETVNIPSVDIGFLADDPSRKILSNPRTSQLPILEETPFFDQLNDNLSQGVSLSLRVPIFSGWQKMTSVENSKINILNAKYALDAQKNTLNQEIYQAHANATAAFKTYQANTKNKSALEKSYQHADEKFKLGALNAFDFLTVKTNLAIAESSLLQAKYDYIFRLKILDFYQGKELTMN